MFESVVAVDSDQEEVCEFLIGTVLSNIGDFEAAVPRLTRATLLNPCSVSASLSLFLCYLDLTRIEMALQEGARLLDAFERSGRPACVKFLDYKSLLAIVRSEQNCEELREQLKARSEQRARWAESPLESSSHALDAQSDAEFLIERAGKIRFLDRPLAFQLLDHAMMLAPGTTGLCEAIKGLTYWDCDEAESAVPHLRQATSLRPLDCSPSAALFFCLLDLGCMHEALWEASRYMWAFEQAGLPLDENISLYREAFQEFADCCREELEAIEQEFVKERGRRSRHRLKGRPRQSH